ncbi:hypothetical protein HK096_005718, partial [Nowakowskiella sp. JEL0078]
MKSTSTINLLLGIIIASLFIYNFNTYLFPLRIPVEWESNFSDCPNLETKDCSICLANVSSVSSQVTDLSGNNAEILPLYLQPTNLQPLVSKLANQMDFETTWFKSTNKKLYLTDEVHMHRKRWEMVYIANAVLEMGLCSKGKKGLVWAAGQEILVSFFAGYGCSILATDMPPDGADISAWSNTGQFASSKESLYLEKYVTKKDFDELVSYRTQDMNHVPIDSRNKYDFMWSTCSVEHVGSILLGQKFIIDAMNLLRPGGVAIHTTEFTLSSLDKTVGTGITYKVYKVKFPYLERKMLIDHVKKHQATVIVGETGSGKTTHSYHTISDTLLELPQYLYESGFTKNGIIAITQPRRVAAISIAKRVSEELDSKLGDLVGYSIRFENMTTPQTKLQYMTDGMLLRELLSDRLLSKYSVIVLDEAHERTLRTDILFGMIHQIMKVRPELRVVIMSATLNAKRFASFFDAKIFEIKGRQFPVEIYHAQKTQPDYMDATLVAVFQIHLELPVGDILVFLT